ncbi:extracellular solute-binding protein [Virgibacillus sp. M23]|uniref:extracellular solute-binding protein n=1 Tax=Virgibacillus sp. M23 TaxID=3079030 RepID=UPI002A909D35|nr:extracellular solute-binding protein [Virgibacillus sp. M23]MDY7043213.1 extracellular solute-binding protein [Virgibacillus sp. M23]
MIMVLCFVPIIISGCKDKESNVEADTGGKEKRGNDELFKLGEEPLEITMFGNYDWYTMPPWGEDVATKWIKENKKVDITAIDGGGNAAQRLSTMIASNDLPDFIWLDKGTDVERLRKGGALVPLDPYLDKYTNLQEWFGESGINMLRSEDGKLYQYPNWYNAKPFGNAGYVVNKGIYEELGSPPLETTEDLYNYLKQVKENYPNITPFETDVEGQGINVLYSAFAENQSPSNIRINAVPEGDKLTSIFTNEEYVESLQYASKLYREGLITQDALTQDRDMVTEKVSSGRVAVYASASPTDLARPGHYNLQEEDSDDGYFMVWPIAKAGLNKDNIYPGAYDMMGWNVSVITKSAEDPEAVFAFLDWLTGPEGQSVLIFGPEGKYWDGFDEEGYPQFTEKYVSDPEGAGKIEEDTLNFQWNGNSNFLDTAKAKFTETLPQEDRNWTTHWQNEITWKTQYDATAYLGIDPLPETTEGQIQQSVGEIAEVARAEALNAKSDEEVIKILEEAEKSAQSVGYADLLAYKTKEWQKNLETLGK